MRVLATLLLLTSTTAEAAVVAPSALCHAAAADAGRVEGIPASLMDAIGRVESGRRDEATGTTAPWPWTINAEGQGTWFDTKAEAVAAVRALQARGMKSIDVGCMQVNLMHHPDAFANLEQAFDPAINAAYAAHFLHRLHDRSGDWTNAVGLYHSATPDLAAAYAQKVIAILGEVPKPPVGPSPLARAWGATLPHGMAQQPPRHAITPVTTKAGWRLGQTTR